MTNQAFAEQLKRLVEQDGKEIINVFRRPYDWQDRATWPKPDPEWSGILRPGADRLPDR